MKATGRAFAVIGGEADRHQAGGCWLQNIFVNRPTGRRLPYVTLPWVSSLRSAFKKAGLGLLRLKLQRGNGFEAKDVAPFV
jgi:hypothetical protein